MLYILGYALQYDLYERGVIDELGEPKVEGGEVCNSRCMNMQFNSFSEFAESSKFITFVVFLLCLIKVCKSVLSEKMDSIGLHTVISLCRVWIQHHAV